MNAAPEPRVTAAVRARTTAAETLAIPAEARGTVVPLGVRPVRLRPPEPVVPPEPRPAKGFGSLRRFGGSLRLGQIACWQVALTLFGVTAGRPWPVAAPAAVCAAGLLAMTALRLRGRWLSEWARLYGRFRIRDRDRYLPKEDGPRAVLHLLAPDATMTSIRLEQGEVAVVSGTRGATVVLRVRDGADPVAALPGPGALAEADVGVQVVFHGVAGNRRHPLAWIAVRAAPESEVDESAGELRTAVRAVTGRLAGHGIGVAALDHGAALRTIASLAHAGEDRGDVREQWRCWCCGPVAQAGFRLAGWSTVDGSASRRLLGQLLTASTGAVVTVSVTAGTDGETAIMRVAATGVGQLERSVVSLRALAARQHVRLDRMNGEHLDAVAACLPLGG